METIAVYWEPKIRVYGVSTCDGLALYTVVVPAAGKNRGSGWVAELEAVGVSFQLVSQQVLAGGEMLLQVVLQAQGREEEIGGVIDRGCGSAGSWRRQSPVVMIYLHGPHFQDRYGIAEAAVGPLMQADIPLLAAGCTGTSIYLVVPDGHAEQAVAALGTTFVIGEGPYEV